MLILTVVLLLGLSAPAFAMEIDRVTDIAGVLTGAQLAQLNVVADEISEKNRCDVFIITVDTLDGLDVEDLAWEAFDLFELGYGSERSILLLLLSIEERDFALIAYGFGNTAFTDHGKDVMLDRHILPLLAENKYFAAFATYLDKASEYLEMARAGNPFDIDNDPVLLAEKSRENFWIKLGITILLPLLIAGVLCFRWKSQMKTATLKREAGQYIPQGGFRLTHSSDQFLFSTETRRTIETNSSGGSSGGTTINSRGGSSRSGKF